MAGSNIPYGSVFTNWFLAYTYSGILAHGHVLHIMSTNKRGREAS